MSITIFERRERAFEAVFFARLDEQRIARLREKLREAHQMERLTHSTGISNPAVLRRILDLGVQAENLQALTLVPLVITAWAGGEVTPAERDAALIAAEREGVSRESGAHHLLECWLDEAPPPELEETWRDYVRALLEQLDDEHASALKQDLLSRCRQVARASGGFLGVAKVSGDEADAIRRIEEAMG